MSSDGEADRGTLLLRGLEAYTSRRKRLVGRMKFLEPLASPNSIVHGLALIVMFWVWANVLARAHTLTVFSFHPVFMSLGVLLFMSEGVLAYRNHAIFSFLAPIMRSHSRIKLQNIHRGFQVLATTAILLGACFIVGNKVKKHRTMLPTSFHSALGFLTISLVIAQVAFGVEKLDAQRSGVETRQQGLHRWHGKAGLVLYDLAILTVLSGIVRALPMELLVVALLLSIMLLWSVVHLQLLMKNKDPDALESAFRNTAGTDRTPGVQLQRLMDKSAGIDNEESTAA